MWFQEDIQVTLVIINLRTGDNNNPHAVKNVLAKESCYYLTPDLFDDALSKGNKYTTVDTGSLLSRVSLHYSGETLRDRCWVKRKISNN